jgi:hypothetical protein
MCKNLLVNIPTERSPGAVIDGAIIVAHQSQGAKLDADIGSGYETAHLPLVAGGGRGGGRHVPRSSAEQALERGACRTSPSSKTLARRAGLNHSRVQHSSRAVSALPGEAAGIVARRPRAFTNLTRPSSSPSSAHDTFEQYTWRQEILFQSGGPVLFIPDTFKGTLQAKRVGICLGRQAVLAARRGRARPWPLLEAGQGHHDPSRSTRDKGTFRDRRLGTAPGAAIWHGSTCRRRLPALRPREPNHRRASCRWRRRRPQPSRD